MLRSINAALTSGPLSVRVSRKLLTVVDVSNGRRWEDEPLVAIISHAARGNEIAAIGMAARSSGGELINPFDHPRVIVSDFTVGEKLMQYAFRSVLNRRWFGTSPTVVIQVAEKLDGGVSQIEWRALQEMAAGAGAMRIYVAKQQALSDSEIKMGFHKNQ